MGRVRTHYDNLRVARDAPTEAIRAAYRTLAQKYHPDRNPAPDAGDVMRVLNEAWAVLGDPQQRAEHDAWIAEQEREVAHVHGGFAFRFDPDEAARPQRVRPRRPDMADSAPPRASAWRESAPVPEPDAPPLRMGALQRMGHWLAHAGWRVYAPLGLLLLLVAVWGLWPTPARNPPYPGPATFPDPSWRPQAGWQVEAGVPVGRWSPTGQPWPTHAGYVEGLPRQATGGLSKITVDNANGSADVHVKLCPAYAEACDGLRHVFVPMGGSFTIGELAPGRYELRYRDLTSGRAARSEPIDVSQVEDAEGARFSVLRVPLYRMTSGNLTFTPLAQDRF